MLFPDEKPLYPDGPPEDGEDYAEIGITTGGRYATAHTRLCIAGQVSDGYSRVESGRLDGRLATDRLKQRIIKLSFYKAAIRLTGRHSPWGALTGIRPAKIAGSLLESGKSPQRTLSLMQKEYFVSPERARLALDAASAALSVKNTLDRRNVSLYIGIPFCPSRCAYCTFVSNSIERCMPLIEPFLDALHKEIEHTAELARQLDLNVAALYIGGGTPTTLSAGQLGTLFQKLSGCFDLSRLREYTIEAGRPDTIDDKKLDVCLENGVTRISVNPQSMSDAVLAAIGRKHSARDVVSAVELVRKKASEKGAELALNMDLIAGLPADSAEGFKRSLESVLEMEPESITVHTLSLKKGSRIRLEGIRIPAADEVSEMLDFAGARLDSISYRPYYLYRQKFMAGGFENVGWSRPGFEGIYNICMMEELHSVISLGGGAVTKLVTPASGRIERIFNPKYPYEYIERIGKILEGKNYITEFYHKEF